MTPRRSPEPRRHAATNLNADVYEHLRDLADLHDTSVSALLRSAVMLLIQACGEELPPSVRHLGRTTFGGQVKQFAHEVNPESLEVPFSDEDHETINILADAARVGPCRWVKDVVLTELRRRSALSLHLN